MMARSEAMKLMENYKTGENYAYLGLAPHFLIFDEYVAFMEMLTTKENAAVLNKLKTNSHARTTGRLLSHSRLSATRRKISR